MRLIAICLFVVFLAAPASAQDWERFYPEAGELHAEMLALLLDPTVPRGEEGRYVWVTLRRLLPDREFPDRHTRYVAVRTAESPTPTDAESPPAFTAADFLAGASGVGVATGIERPAAPENARIWIAVAVPSVVGLDWLAVGEANRFHGAGSLYERQGVVQIGGVDHDVWAQTGASYAVGTEYVFFAADAVVP